MAGVKKVREGPKVTIELECRGCNYLKIWAGMCDTHMRCEKGGWSGCDSLQGHGRALRTPKKCPFRRKAITKFKQSVKG